MEGAKTVDISRTFSIPCSPGSAAEEGPKPPAEHVRWALRGLCKGRPNCPAPQAVMSPLYAFSAFSAQTPRQTHTRQLDLESPPYNVSHGRETLCTGHSYIPLLECFSGSMSGKLLFKQSTWHTPHMPYRQVTMWKNFRWAIEIFTTNPLKYRWDNGVSGRKEGLLCSNSHQERWLGVRRPSPLSKSLSKGEWSLVFLWWQHFAALASVYTSPTEVTVSDAGFLI